MVSFAVHEVHFADFNIDVSCCPCITHIAMIRFRLASKQGVQSCRSNSVGEITT